ncbi:hypothetical protein TARUN_7884, partial [Trichoderma arundinaceum]
AEPLDLLGSSSFPPATSVLRLRWALTLSLVLELRTQPGREYPAGRVSAFAGTPAARQRALDLSPGEAQPAHRLCWLSTGRRSTGGDYRSTGLRHLQSSKA